MNVFIFDFDGTIALQDTTDLILEMPAEGEIWRLEEDWKNGRITSYECMKAQARYLRDVSTKEIQQHLEHHSQLDPGFPELLRFLNNMGFYTLVLSEGYDLALKFHQIHEFIQDITCSRLSTDNGHVTGALELSNQGIWQMYNQACIGCCICKVDSLYQLADRTNVTRSFAVGDGRSDACLFQHVDVSFSLNPKYEATYQVQDLSGVLRILRGLLGVGMDE